MTREHAAEWVRSNRPADSYNHTVVRIPLVLVSAWRRRSHYPVIEPRSPIWRHSRLALVISTSGNTALYLPCPAWREVGKL